MGCSKEVNICINASAIYVRERIGITVFINLKVFCSSCGSLGLGMGWVLGIWNEKKPEGRLSTFGLGY